MDKQTSTKTHRRRRHEQTNKQTNEWKEFKKNKNCRRRHEQTNK
jgi:hypothetical protein